MSARSGSQSKLKSRKSIPGRSLGFRTANVGKVSSTLAKGLPYRALMRFQRDSGLALETIGDVTRISARTRARRKNEGRLSFDESERLYRLAVIYDKAVDLFEGDSNAARHWLKVASPALSNSTPLEMAGSEIGAREVENVIGRLEHGVFT